MFRIQDVAHPFRLYLYNKDLYQYNVCLNFIFILKKYNEYDNMIKKLLLIN